MIKISKLADYSTVILSHLSSGPGKKQSAARIAEETRLPLPTVSKLLKRLHDADLVNSTRGVKGGYQLARAAKSISVADIVIAIEGPLAMTACSHITMACNRSDSCNLKHNWQYINHTIVSLLNQLSLSDMNHPLKKLISLQVLNGTQDDKQK